MAHFSEETDAVSGIKRIDYHYESYRDPRIRRTVLMAVAVGLLTVAGWVTSSHASPFLLKSEHSAPSPRLPFELDLSTYPDVASLPVMTRKVPSIVHYVWLSEPEKDFPFLKYLSFASVMTTLKPEKMLLWRNHEPAGWYWQQLKLVAQANNVTIEQKPVRDVTEILGQKVSHVAHKADILRLEALRAYGGIYLDLDVFVIKDFAPLYNESMVMAQEGHQSDPDRPEPEGLCNAVILAEPYARFITRWISNYDTFDHTKWNDHSVRLPWRLAKQHPDTITTLNTRAIFYPLWTPDHMRLVHETTDYDFDQSGQYAYHAWSQADKAEPNYNPINVWTKGVGEDGIKETSFTRLIRRWSDADLQMRYLEAREQGLVD